MVNRALLILSFLTVAWICLVQSKPWEPEPRTEQWWVDRHNQYVEYSKVNGSSIKILFTGSSVMEYWSTTGQKIFNSKYVPLGAVNYGIGGDQIQHLLWRVINGELDNLNPKMVVIYCGSNNVPTDSSREEIVRGVTETINEIARRLPQTKILYVSIFPRGDQSNVVATWEKITAINEQIQTLDDGEKTVVFNMFNDLISSWGQINSQLYVSDKLHLNEAGYGVWDSSWNTTFFNTLN